MKTKAFPICLASVFAAVAPALGQPSPARDRADEASQQAIRHPEAGEVGRQARLRPRPPQAGPDEEAGPLVSVEFGGGTLQAFAAALRSSTQEPVNISLQGDAGAIRIEPMSLRNVSVASALRAALGYRANQMDHLPDGSTVYIQFDQVQSGQNDAPVFIVTRSPLSERRGPNQIVEVVSIQQLVSGNQPIPPDVVLSAIDAGLMLQDRGNSSRPNIKYHKDSGLLLVFGSPADVSLVRDVVKQMSSDHERMAAEARQREVAVIEQSAAQRAAAAKLQVAEAEAALAQQNLDDLKEIVEKGNAPKSVLGQTQLQVTKAEAARTIAASELDRIQQEAKAGLPPMGAGPPGGPSPDPRDAMIMALQQRVKELEEQVGKLQGGDKTKR